MHTAPRVWLLMLSYHVSFYPPNRLVTQAAINSSLAKLHRNHPLLILLFLFFIFSLSDLLDGLSVMVITSTMNLDDACQCHAT